MTDKLKLWCWGYSWYKKGNDLSRLKMMYQYYVIVLSALVTSGKFAIYTIKHIDIVIKPKA